MFNIILITIWAISALNTLLIILSNDCCIISEDFVLYIVMGPIGWFILTTGILYRTFKEIYYRRKIKKGKKEKNLK